MIDTLIIFAAGRGTRMGDITASIPKSLVKISGKPLLYYSLELARSYNFKKIIINTHYLSEQIEAAIEDFRKANPDYPPIFIEYETVLLETGGTVKKLAKLYNLISPVFTLNSDIIIAPKHNIFAEMENYYNNNNIDILLLLQETKNAFGYTGRGDFNLEISGEIHRNGEGPYPYMFAGMHLLNPKIYIENPDDIFSNNSYYPGMRSSHEEVIVHGMPMDGLWYHATSPEDIETIEKNLLVNAGA